jgi:hypothetical protein
MAARHHLGKQIVKLSLAASFDALPRYWGSDLASPFHFNDWVDSDFVETRIWDRKEVTNAIVFHKNSSVERVVDINLAAHLAESCSGAGPGAAKPAAERRLQLCPKAELYYLAKRF